MSELSQVKWCGQNFHFNFYKYVYQRLQHSLDLVSFMVELKTILVRNYITVLLSVLSFIKALFVNLLNCHHL